MATPLVSAPACQTTFFTERFTGCNAAGNCGWTAFTPPGTVVFDGEKVLLGSSGANPQGLAFHALSGLPLVNLTYQFQLYEIDAPPSGNKLYSTGLFDPAGNAIIAVLLFGDGTVIIAIGAGTFYEGTWTPMRGAIRKVHATLNAQGIPSLSIDGVSIPLTTSVFFPIVFNPDTIGVNVSNDDLDGQGAFDNLFVALGVFPPTTVFC